jgi:hypothetical protein
VGLLFWKGIENTGFRERPDGDWDFFPNGVLGRGYRVTPAQRTRLHQVLRRQYAAIGIVLLPAIIVQAFFQTLLGKVIVFAVAMLLLAPFFLVFRAQRMRIIGDAGSAGGRLTLDEAHEATAAHIPKGRVIFLLIFGPLMTLMGVFVAWIGLSEGDTGALLIGLLCIAIFGFCTWAGIRIWRKRQRFLAAGGHAPRVFD